MILKRGIQIAYVPQHANGYEYHEDVEYGFITSVRGDGAFCRYWSKSDPTELRTKCNSELTPVRYLIVLNTRPQEMVDQLLEETERVKV